jgi:hypothetical protein
MERELLPAEIREEGAKARAAGKQNGDNPYPSASPEFAAWDQGWHRIESGSGDPKPLVDAPTG